MKRLHSIVVTFIILTFFSCAPDAEGFGKKNFHDQYAKKLRKTGLHETAMGRAWFAEADKALSQPLRVSLPYRQVGYFSEDKPIAIGLQFNATRGEKLIFLLKRKPDTTFVIYADLWQVQNNEEPDLLIFFDTTEAEFNHEIDETCNYILRLQPELLGAGEYELSVSVGASFAFPSSSGSIQSFWGAARGSTRKHEGIDIFAARGTPVVAAEDGTITRAGENNLGGKVIFVRVGGGRNISLYYAHLDTQLVEVGQRVKKGDTLGLMGNTGNAKTTSPHLHFGIYTAGGAIDPLPFVNPNTKEPKAVSFPASQLNQFVRLTSNQKISDGIMLDKHQVLFAIAVSTDGLIAQLPQGKRLQISVEVIRPVSDAIMAKKIKDSVFLLATPRVDAPAKKILSTAESVTVLGYHDNYAFIKAHEIIGWVLSSSL